MFYRLFIILVVLILSACDKNDEIIDNVDTQNYFPLFEGKEWVDSITSTWIDSPSNVYDTTLTIQKTVVDSAVQEQSVVKYYCTVFNYENGIWVTDHVYWYELSETQLLRFEDNMTWLDLVFPLKKDKIWNSYAYNVYSDTTLRNQVHSINKTIWVDNEPYDSTLVIYHQMDSTLIYKYTDASIYAYGKGLLRKDKISIVSDDPNYDYTLPIEERIKTGQFISIKRIYNYENR